MIALFLGKSTALKLEVTVVVKIDELQITSTTASHNGTIDISLTDISLTRFKSLGCTGSACDRFSYVVGEASRNAIVVVNQLGFFAVIIGLQILALVIQRLRTSNRLFIHRS